MQLAQHVGAFLHAREAVIAQPTAAYLTLIAGLEQWEQEVKLYVALKDLRLFKQHKLWKAFKGWKSAIHSSKLLDAKTALNKQLFLLSPVFQQPLQQFHALCHELSGMRLHSIQQGQVSSVRQYAMFY